MNDFRECKSKIIRLCTYLSCLGHAKNPSGAHHVHQETPSLLRQTGGPGRQAVMHQPSASLIEKPLSLAGHSLAQTGLLRRAEMCDGG